MRLVVAAFLTTVTPAAVAQLGPSQIGRCDPVEREVTTTPIPEQMTTGLRRHYDLIREMPKETSFLLIGDSIAQYWPIDALRSAFGDGAVNAGVAGDRTQNLLWRLPQIAKTGMQPKNVGILIGNNNVGAGDSACSVVAGIEYAISAIERDLKPERIVLFGITPRASDDGIRNATRTQINAALGALAARVRGLRYVDLEAAVGCDSSSFCKSYRADGIHLSQTGYENLLRSLKMHPVL